MSAGASVLAGSMKDDKSREPRMHLGPLAWGCLGFLALLVLVAVLAPWIAPYPPATQNLLQIASPPDGEHWFGTDNLGRDILSRVMYGAQPALIGPAAIALGAALLGTGLGLIAGFRGGLTDMGLMRGIDLIYAVPPLLVAIVVVGIFGGGYTLAVLVIVVLAAPANARIVRSAVIAQREMPYNDAARVVGVRGVSRALRHILPNIAPTLTAMVLLEFVAGLITLSGLAFLGLGPPAGSTDWGLMISENRSILDLNPWALVVPAVLIMLTAISMTLLGDRVHELLTARGGR